MRHRLSRYFIISICCVVSFMALCILRTNACRTFVYGFAVSRNTNTQHRIFYSFARNAQINSISCEIGRNSRIIETIKQQSNSGIVHECVECKWNACKCIRWILLLFHVLWIDAAVCVCGARPVNFGWAKLIYFNTEMIHGDMEQSTTLQPRTNSIFDRTQSKCQTHSYTVLLPLWQLTCIINNKILHALRIYRIYVCSQ